MTCDEVQRLLSAYIDGELDEARRRAVEEHLKECESCRLDHATLLKTVKMIQSLGQIQWEQRAKRETK